MGVFSFLKNVGEKIMGSSDTKPAQPEDLKKELAKHNLDAEGIEVGKIVSSMLLVLSVISFIKIRPWK